MGDTGDGLDGTSDGLGDIGNSLDGTRYGLGGTGDGLNKWYGGHSDGAGEGLDGIRDSLDGMGGMWFRVYARQFWYMEWFGWYRG